MAFETPLPHPTGMLTDRYELSMLRSMRDAGLDGRRAVFDLFTRRLPEGRAYGVVAGVTRMIDAVTRFRFTPGDLAHLLDDGTIDEDLAAWLATWRFTGRIDAMRDGEIYFPGEPLVTVESTFADAVLIETLLLSVLNHDAAVAAAASRMVLAADGVPLIEMGSRRTHEQAAVDAAAAAYTAGFDTTSNLAAGHRFSVPTSGTAAHAYTLAFQVAGGEQEAFVHQLATHGTDTTLLIDTYDIPTGVRNAVASARQFEVSGPGAVRIDSGDLAEETFRVRVLLDELGATDTGIVVSSDLDEYEISRLRRAGAPVTAFGAGTRLVTGSGHPTAGLVYKLVAVEDELGQLQPVEKRSAGKRSVGGVKSVVRQLDPSGRAVGDLVHVARERTLLPAAADGQRSLTQTVMLDGLPTASASSQPGAGRTHHRRVLRELGLAPGSIADRPPIEVQILEPAPV